MKDERKVDKWVDTEGDLERVREMSYGVGRAI